MNYIRIDECIKFKFIHIEADSPCIMFINGEGMQSADDLYAQTKNRKKYTFCELVVSDWDNLLTPFNVKESLNGRTFGGRGQLLLDSIKKKVIPQIDSETPGCTGLYIAGYSLAGLFSLWSLYETDIFDGCACMSGSLWFPNWDNYVNNECIKKNAHIYLSLGKKEEKTKSELMSTIGIRMRGQYELLQKDENVEKCILEWHDGGHFTNVNMRIAAGIKWLVENDE